MLFFKKKKEKKALMPLGLYLHIPFCVKKCNYCDFLSAPATEEQRERYVDALCKEIRGYKEEAAEYELKTVYFGGGTPSLLCKEQVERLLLTVKETFSIVMEEAEVTMEVNPGTVTKEALAVYRAMRS